MKIGSVNSIFGQYNKIRADAAYMPPKLQPAADQVELSPEARLFTEAFSLAKKSMLEPSPAQTFRANAIMEQMRGGAYHVEASAVCDKLLA